MTAKDHSTDEAQISPSSQNCSSFVWLIRPWSRWCLLVQRLTIGHTTSDELRPFRHHGDWIRLFRQQTPKGRMVPTQLVPVGVAMLADALTQFFNLRNQLLACHFIKVFIHKTSSLQCKGGHEPAQNGIEYECTIETFMAYVFTRSIQRDSSPVDFY
jgi:hypothetical protein